MAKKPNPLGEPLGISDDIEGIKRVIRGFYGAEKTLRKRHAEPGEPQKYDILHESGEVVKLTYVYEKFDTFCFASKPK